MSGERCALILPPLTLGPLVYALLRVIEAFSSPPTDPSVIVWSTPIALFHRIGLVFYVLLLLLVTTWIVARRRPDFPLRFSLALLPVSVVAIVVQVAFWP